MNGMKKHSIILILVLFSLFINGCKYDFILPEEVPPITGPVSFSTDIAPIFSTGDKCTSCHKSGGLGTPDFSNPATLYSKIVPGLVDLASPAGSKIYSLPTGNHYKTISASEAALVLAWITDGALDN
jgi:hypothetical protein